MKIQYGCGLCAPKTWENFDSSPTLTLQKLPILGILFQGGKFPNFPKNIRKGNIAKGLKLANSSADMVYCSHVLEHLTLEELRAALLETHRILKNGGIFRFVLPDLEEHIKAYCNTESDQRSIKFMESTLLGLKRRDNSFSGFLRDWLGGSKHLWMWDYKGLAKELNNAGFSQIRRAEFGDSDSGDFSAVEDEGRWVGCLGIECIKASQSSPDLP